MPNHTRGSPVWTHSDKTNSSHRKRARLNIARKHSPLHDLLTARQRRRTFSDTSGELHDSLNLERSTAKSVAVFRGEARGILHGIFFILLLKFFLALMVIVGTVGIVAMLILMTKQPDVSLTSYLVFY